MEKTDNIAINILTFFIHIIVHPFKFIPGKFATSDASASQIFYGRSTVIEN